VTNSEILEHIATWQGLGCVHPLTCRVDGCGQNLVGREVNGEVVLVCPDCGYVQKYIPPVVLSSYTQTLRDAMPK